VKALAGHELASSPHLNRIAQQSPQTVVMLVNLLGNFSGYFHLRKAATAATVTQPNTEPFTTSARCVSLDIGTPLLHEGAFYSCYLSGTYLRGKLRTTHIYFLSMICESEI